MKKDFPLGNWFPANFLGGSRKESDRSSLDNSNSASSEFGHQVFDNGNGTVSVRTSAINNSVTTGLDPQGKPTRLWLKATFNEDGDVTSSEVVTTSQTESDTVSTRILAVITWNGNSPRITQSIKGSISISSCGYAHLWTNLFGY